MKRDLKKLRILSRRRGRGVSASASDTRLYYSALVAHTKAVASVFEQTVLRAIKSNVVNDSTQDDIRRAWREFDKRAAALKTAAQAAAIFAKVAEHIDDHHKKQFVASARKAIAIDISKTLKRDAVSKSVNLAVRENIALIKSIQTSYKARASKIISETLLHGGDLVSLQKQLKSLGGFKSKYDGTETRRAKIIARDQTQKLTQAIDRARQRDAGITHYFWNAVIDERTDPDHKANDGKRFAWNRPPKTGHPGTRPLCRCTAQPDFSTIDGAEDLDEAA